MENENNGNRALWLPPGSIRAIIALGLVSATIYVTATTGSFPEALGALTGMAIGYYFGTK